MPFGDRVREAMVRASMDETALAHHSGLSLKTISRYLDRRDAPNRGTNVTAIAEALGVNSQWLEKGEGEMGQAASGNADPPAPTWENAEPETRPDLVKVAEYGEVGAGPGRVPLEVLSFRIVTRAEFVADFGSEPPESTQGIPKSTVLGYFTVAGDSAAPVFFDRERVPVEVLDEPTQFFRNDVIYAFRWEGDLMLKRLRLLGRKKRTENGREVEYMEVEAESLNPSVKPQTYRVTEGDDFAVVAVARVSQKQQLYTALVGKLFAA